MQDAISFSIPTPVVQPQQLAPQTMPVYQQQPVTAMPVYQEPQPLTTSIPVLDMTFFTSGNASIEDANPSVQAPKRGRPPKKKTIAGVEVIVPDNAQDDSTKQLHESYEETTGVLRTTILQIDQLAAEVNKELQDVRSSKTLKGKYMYVSNMASVLGTLLNSKVSAAKAINDTITTAHKLELQRIKDLGLNKQEVNEDKAIMDMYNAFMSAPAGTGMMLPPTMADMVSPSAMAMVRPDGSVASIGAEAPLNHVQLAMRYEHNPNVKTVVVYDAATGRRWFDIQNIQTGESIPGLQRPDEMFLNDTYIDTSKGIARNANLDQIYPLVVVGNAEFSKY